MEFISFQLYESISKKMQVSVDHDSYTEMNKANRMRGLTPAPAQILYFFF